MGYFSDIWDFTKFWNKDQLKAFKDDPWRLLTGAGPIETEVWNKILGKDDEPIHNAVGGPQGSGFFGLGSGGIFDEYELESGRSKSAAVKTADVGEIIAGILGLIFTGGALAGGAGASGGGAGATSAAAGGTGAGAAGASAGAAGGSATGAGAGSGSGFSLFGSEGMPSWMQWVQRGNTLAGMMPGGQEQQQAPQTAGLDQHGMALMGQALRLQQQRKEAEERERAYKESFNAQPIRFG